MAILISMDYCWPARIGNKYINLSPLVTSIDRSRGYQHVEECPCGDQGLLFVFEDEQQRKFHMRNVGFDLDLLGFNSEGRLIFVLPMHANAGLKYETLPCKYAVEVSKGWGSDLLIGVSKIALF